MCRIQVFIFALVIVAYAATATTFGQGAVITGKADVKDGDSVLVGEGKGVVDVRLYGVDAPENDQTCNDDKGAEWKCGAGARKALAALVNGKPIRCEVVVMEPNGSRRPIAVCAIGTLVVNDAQVRDGWAVAFERYLKSDPKALDHFKGLEAQAKTVAAGMWRGTFQPPWEFRSDRWARAAAKAPNACPVIVNTKSRIYRSPWSRGYDRYVTSMLTGKNGPHWEWLCSTDEAAGKGYQPAR